MKTKKILYITYDGLTDPLGQSQILPYLKGLSKYGYQFTVLSFEKKDRLLKEKPVIDKLIKESGIEWVPMSFTSKPPLLSKLYDAIQMHRKAVELQKKKSFDMVHCRSYIAADVGLHLKKKFGIKFFFDMRGFWADEKKEGSWNVNNPIFSRIYKHYKTKEAEYLKHADYIILLTEAGKKEIMTWSSFQKHTPVSVIPCCADMKHFSLTDGEQKRKAREKMGLKNDELVISYLGSVGAWYMLDEMILFFKKIKEQYASAKFLIITHTPRQIIDLRIAAFKLETKDFIVIQASRSEVPLMIKASDINISFIKPVFSKISSSPTKLGEVLSMGIPVIVNSGVGDVKEIVESTNSGVVINDFSEDCFKRAIDTIPILIQKTPKEIRDSAKNIFDLNLGIQLYKLSYDQLFHNE